MRILLLILILTSCASKKINKEYKSTNIQSDLTESYLNKIDSLHSLLEEKDSVYVEITKPSNENINVKNPCDSLTGKLKDLDITAGNTKVSSKDGELTIETNCEESIKKYESEISNLKEHISELIVQVDTTSSTSFTKIEDNSEVTIKPWFHWKSYTLGVLSLIVLRILWWIAKKLKWI